MLRVQEFRNGSVVLPPRPRFLARRSPPRSSERGHSPPSLLPQKATARPEARQSKDEESTLLHPQEPWSTSCDCRDDRWEPDWKGILHTLEMQFSAGSDRVPKSHQNCSTGICPSRSRFYRTS